jgi:hypothetical protein
MSQPPGLKAALKRGALVTAANWPLVATQFVAESTLKLLLAVPVLGGVFLVALLMNADVGEMISGSPSEIVQAVFNAMRASPPALVSFAAAFLLVMLGGSALTFVVKSGTVAVLAQADAAAGPIERPPLSLSALRRAGVTDIEPFLAGCSRLWRRYVVLGGCLLLVYAGTAIAYIGPVLGGLALAWNSGILLGWTLVTFTASSVVIVWLTIVNLLYLLTQMIIAVEDVSIREAVVGVARFVRRSLREVAGIFGVVLVLVAVATVASIVATAGLGFIAFVPLAGVIVLPLTAAGWLLRGFVFQYLALTALGAYLTEYRHHARAAAPMAAVEEQRPA